MNTIISNIEYQWESLFEERNPVLVTGVLAFTMHEFVYFGRFIPFLICDYVPFFNKYKIQSNKANLPKDYWKCTKQVLYQHFLFEGPLIFLFHPMATLLGMQVRAPFPSFTTILPQIVAFFIFEDTFHYWAHRIMHIPAFYRRVHKVHHEYAAPFGIAAEYAHPLETIILGCGTLGGPLLLQMVWGHLHLATMLLWVVLRLLQAIDAHSGYDFPWSLCHWVPFWAGADHHDYHHQAFIGNYSSSFRWWDYLFGTDVKYRAYRKRQAEEKLKLKLN